MKICYYYSLDWIHITVVFHIFLQTSQIPKCLSNASHCWDYGFL